MELLAATVVAVGLLAVLARFILRAPSGDVRLPRVVDESIGMWALRRVTGRPLGERDEGEGSVAASDVAHPTASSQRPPPTPPGRWDLFPPPTSPSIAPARRVASMRGVIRVRTLRQRPATPFGSPSQKPSPNASSNPGPSQSSVEGTDPAGSSTGDPRPFRGLSLRAWPWPSPTWPLGAALVLTIVALGATALPRDPQREVLGIIGRPDAAGMPIAVVDCAAPVVLSVTCTGADSLGAVTYRFDFGDGQPSALGTSSHASHTYGQPGAYAVTLTVTDEAGRTDEQATTVSIP